MNNDGNRIQTLRNAISELESLKDEAKTVEYMGGISEPGIGLNKEDITDLRVSSTGKVYELKPNKPAIANNLRKAGYVDALVLSFMVATFGVAAVLCMIVRINMVAF